MEKPTVHTCTCIMYMYTHTNCKIINRVGAYTEMGAYSGRHGTYVRTCSRDEDAKLMLPALTYQSVCC